MEKLLLTPPPADVLRPDSKADPEILNRYLQLQILLLEKSLREGADQARKQVARRLVMERVTPVAFWVLLSAVAAGIVSAQNWTPLMNSLGKHPTLTALSDKIQALAGMAGQALTYKDLLIPIFLFVSALALRLTTTRIQGTAIVIGLNTLMMLTFYTLTANADLEWSWRRSALFFVPGTLLAVGLVQRLGTIELQLYRGTADQWVWFRSLPRRYAWAGRGWEVTCWVGRLIRAALRLRRLSLLVFLILPIVAAALLVTFGFMPAGLRGWASVTLFSVWVVWGYAAILARPGMLKPPRGSRKQWAYSLVPVLSLPALVVAIAAFEASGEKDVVSALVIFPAGFLFLMWIPWGLTVAVRSNHFFQPSRRTSTMLVFASLPGLSALLLVVAYLWTDGFSTGIPYPALQGAGAVFVVGAFFLYPLWLLWAFAVLPTGLRQTYVALSIWLVIGTIYGPALFLSVMVGLLAISIPLSLWRARHLLAAGKEVPA